MKKSCLLLVVLTSLIFIVSCGGAGSPSDVVTKSTDLAIEFNMEEAFSYYVTKDGKPMPEKDLKQILSMVEMLKEAKKTGEGQFLTAYEIVKEEISEDGKTAVVEVNHTFNNGKAKTEKLNLMNIDGNWKIVYN